MLNIFLAQPEQPNIFEDFAYMDKRELDLRQNRETMDFFTQF